MKHKLGGFYMFLEWLGNFVNFALGMVTGMILFSAIYIYFNVRGKNIDVEAIKRPNIDVSEEELRLLILNKQKQFKRNKKLGNQSIAKMTFELSYELIEEIAKYFFPESKYPMLELSVHELITLSHYITNRIDDLLDKPLLKNTKNVRMSKVMAMYDKKKQIEQTKLVKAAKKYKVSKVLKYTSMTLNAVNPVYWFRKLVINTSVDVMTKKVCIVIIGIVGEETTNVYSKKLFNKEVELGLVDDDVIKLLEGGDDDDDLIDDEGVL